MDYLVMRFLSSFFVGTILSQTGSLIQFSSRNILASTSTLGIDGLAVLWILICHSIFIFFKIEVDWIMTLYLGLPIFLLLGLFYSSKIFKHKNIEKLIFLGITFNLLVGAIYSLWQFLFLAFNLPFPVELWFGHFRFSNELNCIALIIFEFFFLMGFLTFKKDLKTYSLGRSVSKNLNLNLKSLYSFIFIAVCLGTFTVVALFGAFPFLGLIFPIISRKLFFKKFDLKGDFITGAFLNGFILMLIDFFCYEWPIYGAEIPVGLIATAVGAAGLLLLIYKSDNRLEILANGQK